MMEVYLIDSKKIPLLHNKLLNLCYEGDCLMAMQDSPLTKCVLSVRVYFNMQGF